MTGRAGEGDMTGGAGKQSRAALGPGPGNEVGKAAAG